MVNRCISGARMERAAIREMAQFTRPSCLRPPGGMRSKPGIYDSFTR